VRSEPNNELATLKEEMKNLHEILTHVYSTPEEFSLSNIDVAGKTFPFAGGVGGDHIIVVDFKERFDLDHRIELALERGNPQAASKLEECRSKLGVLLVDVSGHQVTDALLAAMLHQAFLVGVMYELETRGHVSTALFEILNTRFYQSSSVTKYLTMVYGEISEDGRFRFISAGHPQPLIFSREFDCFVDIEESRMVNMLPLGMFPSAEDVDRERDDEQPNIVQECTVNEVSLMAPGDIILLATDGLMELERDDDTYCPLHLEQVVRQHKDLGAAALLDRIYQDVQEYAQVDDDVSIVVLKRRG